MNIRLISFAIFSALALGACQEKPSETAKDVADARQEASKEVAEAKIEANQEVAAANEDVNEAAQALNETSSEARQELTEAESEAMMKAADAQYDVMIAEADGRQKVANEACDAAAPGNERDSCKSTADAVYAADKAAAAAIRDAAKVAAERHN